MPIKQSGKRFRAPSRGIRDDNGLPLMPPVYMASCGNRPDTMTIVTPVAGGEFYFPVFACSSELFYFDAERGIARTMSRRYSLGTRVAPQYRGERFRENASRSGDWH